MTWAAYDFRSQVYVSLPTASVRLIDWWLVRYNYPFDLPQQSNDNLIIGIIITVFYRLSLGLHLDLSQAKIYTYIGS